MITLTSEIKHIQLLKNFYRIDNRDYPEVAVREALLNCLVHRDYGYSSSILISMYEDRLEFTSIGGLVTGVTLEDVMMGISVCRNKKLANVFYRFRIDRSLWNRNTKDHECLSRSVYKTRDQSQ